MNKYFKEFRENASSKEKEKLVSSAESTTPIGAEIKGKYGFSWSTVRPMLVQQGFYHPKRAYSRRNRKIKNSGNCTNTRKTNNESHNDIQIKNTPNMIQKTSKLIPDFLGRETATKDLTFRLMPNVYKQYLEALKLSGNTKKYVTQNEIIYLGLQEYFLRHEY